MNTIGPIQINFGVTGMKGGGGIIMADHTVNMPYYLLESTGEISNILYNLQSSATKQQHINAALLSIFET